LCDRQNGKTALIIASENGYADILNLLVEANAATDITDNVRLRDIVIFDVPVLAPQAPLAPPNPTVA
jgi:ankyrin repeat protein